MHLIENLHEIIIDSLYATVGVHPTRCKEFESSGNVQDYLDSLYKLIIDNDKKVVAYGEFGLGNVDWQ